MLAIIEIFGGRAAMSEEFSGMMYADIMDDILRGQRVSAAKSIMTRWFAFVPNSRKMVGKDTIRRAGKEDGCRLVCRWRY